jgi:hypothetical protein
MFDWQFSLCLAAHAGACEERRRHLAAPRRAGGPRGPREGRATPWDAALAAAITLTVVEPTSKRHRLRRLRDPLGRREARGSQRFGPARRRGWTPERFAGRTAMPVQGWDSVTVPGCVSAWVALSKRYGQAPPSAISSRPPSATRGDGFVVSPITALSWARAGAGPQGLLGVRVDLPAQGPRAPGRAKRFYCPQQAEDARGNRGHPRRELLPRQARRAHRPRGPGRRRRPHGGGFRRPTVPTGWSPSRWITAATACTRSRRTGKASWR